MLRGAGEALSAVITHPTAAFGPGDWKHNLLPLFRAAKRGSALAVPLGESLRDAAAWYRARGLM